MFILGKTLASLIFPPGLFILLVALALLALMRKRRRLAVAMTSSALILLYLVSISPIADAFIVPLENRYPPLADASKAEAIVVLGGGSVLGSPEYDGHTALAESGLARAAYAARLSRRYGLPIIYSGGMPLRAEGTESEAEAARMFYEGIGIEPGKVTIETKSRDTAENAAFVARLKPGDRVILVTSAFHMPRSVLSFKKAGIDPIPAPTDYKVNRASYRFIDFLPSVGAMQSVTLALHEYVGILYYRLTL